VGAAPGGLSARLRRALVGLPSPTKLDQGFVYELDLASLSFRDGEELLRRYAFSTVNEVPSRCQRF